MKPGKGCRIGREAGHLLVLFRPEGMKGGGAFLFFVVSFIVRLSAGIYASRMGLGA